MAQVKKATEKPATKKTVTKKATASVKTKIELQYAEKNISYDDIVKKAKEFWTLELGNKAEDLKSLDLYVKPEENRVYYVANGKETGSFEL